MGLGVAFFVVLVFVGVVEANVVVVGRNVSVAFRDLEANFAPTVKSSGVCGILYHANPLDACTPLANGVTDGRTSQFALIIRGNCSFVEKVKNAQKAGFKAAIVYDNEDDGALISMGGSSSSIRIYAVFVSKASGEALRKYAGLSDMNVWIIPTFENSAWSIMAIAFISLLAMSAVLATCFFVRRHSVRREGPRANVTEFHGMSSGSVKAMPSLIFTTVQEDNCTSMTCAICLEDYAVGEKIRILPCRHKFHAFCVDMWLTSWRTFCPVCKRDARIHIDIPPASEYTPLLSSRAASATAIGLSSFHSSLAGSPSIQILPSPSRASLTSRNHSLSSTPHVLNQLRSYNNSPATSIGRNSIDPRNMSSYRSHAPYLLSSHSLGVAFASPVASRLAASPQVNSSGYGSPSYLVGSSSRQSYLRNSESMTSFLSSAQSLPDC